MKFGPVFKHCWCFLWLLFWTTIASGQSGNPIKPIPDNYSLVDPVFFQNRQLAQKLSQASEMVGGQKEEALRSAYARAKQNRDIECQAFAAILLARYFFDQNEITQAFDWANRSRLFEKKLPRLSSIRQFVLKEIGFIYIHFGAYRMATPYLKEVLRISELRDTIPNLRVYGHCADYAIFGLQLQGKYDSAFMYYNKAIAFTQKTKNQFWEAAACNNYGMALVDCGKSDSAYTLFNRAFNLLPMQTMEDSLFACSVRDNIAQLLEQDQKWGAALELYEINYEYFKKYKKDENRHVNACIRSANVMLKMGRLKDALEREQHVNEILKGKDSILIRSTFLIRTNFKIELLKQLGNWKEVSLLSERREKFNDSLSRVKFKLRPIILENLVLKTANEFDKNIQLAKLNTKKVLEESRLYKIRAYLIALVSVLCFLIIVFIYRRNYFKNKAILIEEQLKRELTEVQFQKEVLLKEKLNSELQQQKQDLTDYALALSQKKKVLNEVINNLSRIKKSKQPAQEVQDLIMVLKGQIKAGINMSIDPDQMKNLNTAFFLKLKEINPKLSATERDLCGLLRLKFSTKEISAMRSVEPASVRISKFRLKKKLGLNAEIDLDEFLSKL